MNHGSHTERVRSLLRGFGAGVLTSGITAITQIVVTPVVLALAGREALGLYSVIFQLVDWATIADPGMSVATGRWLAQAHPLGDGHQQFRTVLRTGKRILRVTNGLSGIVVAVAAIALPASDFVPGQSRQQVMAAMLIVAGWVSCRGSLAIYGSALAASHRMGTANTAAGVGQLVRGILTFGFVWVGWGVLGLAVAQVGSDLATVALQRLAYRRAFPAERHAEVRVDRALSSEVVRFGLTYLTTVIAGRLFLSTDALVVGQALGAGMVAVYYTTQLPTAVLTQLVWRAADSAVPAMSGFVGMSDTSGLKSWYLMLLRWHIGIASLLALGVAGFNGVIVSAWVGPQQYAGSGMSMGLAVLVVMSVLSHLNALTLLAIGAVRRYAGWSVAVGVLKVAASYILVGRIGVAGPVWGSVLGELASNLLFGALVFRYTRCSIRELWHHVAAPGLKTGAAMGLGALAILACQPGHWPQVAMWVLMFATALSWAVAAYVFVATPAERIVARRYITPIGMLGRRRM